MSNLAKPQTLSLINVVWLILTGFLVIWSLVNGLHLKPSNPIFGGLLISYFASASVINLTFLFAKKYFMRHGIFMGYVTAFLIGYMLALVAYAFIQEEQSLHAKMTIIMGLHVLLMLPIFMIVSVRR